MKFTVNTGDGINWEADTEEQLKNDVLNLLKTRRGEVPFMPGLGLESKYIGRPVSEIGPAARNDITEQLEKWLPEVEIESISITADESGDLSVTIEVNST